MTTVYIKTSQSWQVPAGVTSVNVTLVGGGGGANGGLYCAGYPYGGYAARGAFASAPVTTNGISVTPGSYITIVIGDYGLGGTGNNTCSNTNWGHAGTATTFTGATPSPGGGYNSYFAGNYANPGYAGTTADGGSPGSSAGQNGQYGGAAAAGYGAGGGGGGQNGTSTGYNGGAGSNGICIITYTIAPTASFTHSAEGNAPKSITFTDTSTGSPTSWDWNFGDGSAHEYTQNPSHTYTTANTFSASLIAINDGGSSAPYSHNIVITAAAPVAAFVGVPVSGSAPLNVQFTDQSTNSPTSWYWSFGDTGFSMEQNPSHTYTGAGTYTVTLTATNAGGSDGETKSNYISSSSAPIAKFVTQVKSFFQLAPFGAAGWKVKLYDKSTFAGSGPSSWLWTLTSYNKTTQTSTKQNPEITLPPEEGVPGNLPIPWKVTLVVKNTNNVSSAGATIDYAIIQRFDLP